MKFRIPIGVLPSVASLDPAWSQPDPLGSLLYGAMIDSLFQLHMRLQWAHVSILIENWASPFLQEQSHRPYPEEVDDGGEVFSNIWI